MDGSVEDRMNRVVRKTEKNAKETTVDGGKGEVRLDSLVRGKKGKRNIGVINGERITALAEMYV